jgi:hypothetical protein
MMWRTESLRREPTYHGTDRDIPERFADALVYLARPGLPVRYLDDLYRLDEAMEDNRK